MRILVISDIHANLSALEAVLEDAGEFEAAWCLGDLVGYGPDPNECIQRVRSLPNLVCLLGNHDAAALGQIDLMSFNPEARQAVQWTQELLTPANLEYLRNLPERHVAEPVTLVHGSPRQPIWEYLLDARTATKNFAHFDTDYCFVGHSHLPVIYHLTEEYPLARLYVPDPQSHIELEPRAILNPGSVGQPRDHNPDAAYAIFDSEALTWSYRRVAYDIAGVQQRMKDHDLPVRHIERLSAGW
jgi:diadenosine tetraphosphatase ApaH/serine/threonine PP2A family protein phosphatase